MRKPVLAALAVLAIGPVIAGTLPGAGASSQARLSLGRPVVGADAAGFPGAEAALGDADRRGPALAPLAAARRAVAGLGAGTTVSWTQYGTVKTLTRAGGYLATGVAGADPTARAKGFLSRHADLLGLSPAQVRDLEVRSALPLPGSTVASVVTLQQRLGGRRLVEDGLVIVTLRGDKVAAVSGSAVPAALLGSLSADTPTVDVAHAVLAAAADAGIRSLSIADLRVGGKPDAAGFTLVAARGLPQQQRARLAALPTTDQGTRLVWETDVLDVAGSTATATMSYVDAVTGTVLLRRDAVDTLADTSRSVVGQRTVQTAAAAPNGGTFSGAYTEKGCGPLHPLDVPVGTVTIAGVVAAVFPGNDIVVKVLRNGVEIASVDNGVAEEAFTATATPPATAADTFAAKVCPLGGGSVSPTQMQPYDYAGSYFTTDQAATLPPLPSGAVSDGSVLGPATWRAFSANPELPRSDAAGPDDRDKICGTTRGDTSAKAKDCSPNGFTYFDESPFPYDVDAVTGLPTFTTIGNNAVTSNAQASSSLTPGGPLLPPVGPTRDYAPAFTDSWHATKCDPVTIANPADRANVDAAIVNLFVGHNRIHDFAHRLGLTEPRGAMQVTNFGKGGAEGDPELGNTQNAALTSQPLEQAGGIAGVGLTGRDNANQITLQDGVPGITNQYLFQPVLGFYSPCTDGDLDSSIFLHEYTHAISNRLIAGPDTGLSGAQGGSMGESWSDLDAVEYLNAFGLAGKRGEDPFSLGAYATGDSFRGIRDFNLLQNPLNYSDVGFDTTGPEPHADGEIWNGIQIAVRQALVKKYDATFSSKDLALQAACALGRTTTNAKAPSFDGCPGNRRWITYIYDSLIMQGNGAPSMVDMKNMQLAADMARTGGVDQQVMAETFAARGLGAGSKSAGSDDTDPTPGFDAPKQFAADNTKVTFALVDADTGKPVEGDVHIGTFQARTNPVASTVKGSSVAPTASIVKGSYQLVVRAAGHGLQRFTLTVPGGGSMTKRLVLARNLASTSSGATISGKDWVRLGDVVDDDEATDGGVDGSGAGIPVAGRSFTVALQGRHTIRRIAVSALHRPAKPAASGQPADFQGRLLGLHEFDVQASSDGGKTYKTVYRSPQNFFPTGPPRAVAPDLQLKTVDLPTPVQADHLRLLVRSNTCTGTPYFRGDKDNDPNNSSDCPSTANAQKVTVTEFQAFGSAAVTLVSAPRSIGTGTGSLPSTARGTLPTTGGGTAAAGLGLLLLMMAGIAVRRRDGV